MKKMEIPFRRVVNGQEAIATRVRKRRGLPRARGRFAECKPKKNHRNEIFLNGEKNIKNKILHLFV